MPKILFVAATEREIAPLSAAFGDKYHCVVTGMGPINMAIGAIGAIEEFKPDCLFVVGIAGAIDRQLQIGEVVMVESDYEADHGAWRAEDQKFVSFGAKKYKSLCCLDGAKYVSGRTVSTACTPLVVDDAQVESMEGAACFAAASASNIRFGQLRAISNYVGDPRSEWRIDEAIEALTKYVVKFF